MQFGMVAPPFNTTLTINQPQTNPVPLYQLGKNVFPLLSFPPLDKTFAASLPVNTNAFLVNPDSRSPYINQWNLSIQRSISNNDLLELAYSDRADTSCRTATTPTSAASRQT